MSDRLQQAITAIKSGDKETGAQLLAEVLKTDRRNENRLALDDSGCKL